jgi:hypothetical protein
LQGGRNDGQTSQQRPHERALPEDENMMETDNSDSPAPKKDEEDILDLINEMTQGLEIEPELTLLSAEVPPSGDIEDDVLELTEEAPGDDVNNGLTALSEKLTADVNDAADDRVLELTMELPEAEATDADPLALSEEILSLENSAEDILELSAEVPAAAGEDDDVLDLSDEAPPMAEAGDDVITLSTEAPFVADNDEDIIDLSDEASPMEEAGGDETAETDTVSGNIAPKGIQHAKDLVLDGFELGEALDFAIDKEMIAKNDLGTALGLGLGLESDSSEEARSGVSDSGAPPVSSAQLEAAIERVIDRMLGSKIDLLLTAAIEKAVSREIMRIKRLLSETLPDD